MDARALLQREAGGGLRGPRQQHAAPWGGMHPEGLVRKLALGHGLESELATQFTTVDFDCSGSFLATAGDDCALNVYSSEAGRLLRTFDPGHVASIMALQYLPGSRGELLLTGGGDKQVRVVNVERGAVKPYSCHEARVRCLAAIDGSVVLSGADDGGVRLFDLRQSQELTGQQQEARSLLVNQRSEGPSRSGRVLVNSISVDPLQPHYFATGGTDPIVRIYDLRKLPRPGTLDFILGARQPPWATCLVPEHLRGGALGHPLQPGSAARSHTGVAATAACTAWYVGLGAGGRAPLACGHAAEVELLEAAQETPGCGGGAIGGSGGGASGLVASAARDGVLRVWRLSGGGQQQPVPLVELQSDAACTAASFAPPRLGSSDLNSGGGGGNSGGSGGSLPRLAAGYSDGSLRLFDVSRRAVAWSALRHPSPIAAVCWHPARPLLLTASRDGAIAVTHANTGRLAAFCQDFTPAVTPLHALAATPGRGGHGNSGVAAAAWLDRLVLFEAPWEPAAAAGAVTSADGGCAGSRRVAVISEYRCPEVPDRLPEGAEARVAFVPSGTPGAPPRLLLFCSPCLGAEALLLDVASGSPLRRLALPAPAASLAASPCGRLVAAGLADGCVLLADPEGEASAVLMGHARPVRALAFCGGGAALASAAGDAMWVWQRDGLRVL